MSDSNDRSDLILALDQGSSAAKALIVDPRDGRTLGTGRVELEGFSGEEFVRASREAVRSALSSAGDPDCKFAVAISNQRSTLLFLDESGTPAGEIVPWWDKEELSPELLDREERFRELTGLPLLPQWWSVKLAARKDKCEKLRPATVDTLLISWLTGGNYFTDVSNAARTGLLDLSTLSRSEELSDLLGVPRGIAFPEVLDSTASFGKIAPGVLGSEVELRGSVTTVVGDAGAARYGAVGERPGVISIAVGSGAFLQASVDSPKSPPEGVYLAPAWKRGSRVEWVWEAAVPAMSLGQKAGLDAAGLIEGSWKSLEPSEPAGELLAIIAPNGFGALGPSGQSGVRLEGDWASASAEEKFGAIIEGLVLLVARAVTRLSPGAETIVLAGGLSKENLFCRLMADYTGMTLERVEGGEASVWGAARLAARSLEMDIPVLPQSGKWTSRISPDQRRSRLETFERALLRL